MKSVSPSRASWRTSVSSKRPVRTFSSTTAGVVPGFNPAKIGPLPPSTRHISVFGSPPVSARVSSFGWTCTLRRCFASMTLNRSGKTVSLGALAPISARPYCAASSSSVQPARGPSATVEGELAWPEISQDSAPQSAVWMLALNVSG